MHILSKNIDKDEKIVVLAVTLLSFLYILPFIIANIYYVDDLSRATTGYVGWGILGRPLSDGIMLTMSFSDFRLTDVSPLPIILSALLLSLTICFCGKQIDGKLSYAKAFIFSPLLINPYFLQNLSYKYDNLPMSVSVALVALSYIFGGLEKTRWFFASVSLLILSLCAYQTSANIFIGLIAAGIILDCYYGKNTIINATKRSASFLLAYIIYTFIVAPRYLKTNRGEIVGINSDGIKTISENLLSAEKLIEKLCTSEVVKYLSPLILIAALAVAFLIIYASKIKHRPIMLLTGFALVCSPVIALIAISGPLFLLKGFGFVPRVMTGFSGTLIFLFSASYIGLDFVCRKQNKLSFLKIYLLAPIIFSFSLCYSYMNAAKAQNDYEKSIIQSVFSFVTANIQNDENLPVYILGEPRYSEIFKTNAFKFPIIFDLYKRMYDWTSFMNLNMLGIDNLKFSFDRTATEKMIDEYCKRDINYILNNKIYSISKDNVKYVIWLNSENNRVCK